MLLGPLDVGIVSVALPSISASHGDDASRGQLVVVAYLALLTIAYIPLGRLADRRSPLVVLRLGLLIFSVGALLVALGDSFAVVLAGRALQGLGAAAAVSGGQAVAFADAGSARAGRSLGFVHVAVGAGMLAGPVFGGLVLERFGWQTAFLVEPPLALAAALLARGSSHALLARDRPSVLAVLRQRGLAAGLLIALVAFVAMSANMFLVPYLLQRPLALGPSSAGLLMTIVPLAILVGAVPAGALADRHGSRWPATIGLALVSLGIAGLAIAARTEAVIVAGAALAAYGAGATLFQSPNNRAVLAAAPPGGLGLASGLLGSSRQLGQIVGVIVSGSLIRVGGGLDDARAYTGAFITLAALAALTTLLAASSRR